MVFIIYAHGEIHFSDKVVNDISLPILISLIIDGFNKTKYFTTGD